MDRALLALLLALIVSAEPGVPAAGADAPLRFEVVFHVATRDERPVVDEAWRTRALTTAEAHFAPAGVTFEVAEVRTLGEEHATLRTISDRRILRRYLRPRRINVFVVDAILDPHPSAATRRASSWQGFEPSGRLAGAHIEVEGRTPRTFLLIHGGVSPLTFTHELGHFFGASHSRDPTNIMSYGRHRARFSEAQLATFRRRARRYARERTVRVTGPGRPSGRRADRPAGP